MSHINRYDLNYIVYILYRLPDRLDLILIRTLRDSVSFCFLFFLKMCIVYIINAAIC